MTDGERRIFEGLVASAYTTATVAALALDGALDGANLIVLDKAKDADAAAHGVRDLLVTCIMDLERACKMI